MSPGDDLGPPGWYVIEDPYQDPARVVAGPLDRDDAEGRARMAQGSVTVMHTPALVNSVKNEGYTVEWGPDAERPEPLREGGVDA